MGSSTRGTHQACAPMQDSWCAGEKSSPRRSLEPLDGQTTHGRSTARDSDFELACRGGETRTGARDDQKRSYGAGTTPCPQPRCEAGCRERGPRSPRTGACLGAATEGRGEGAGHQPEAALVPHEPRRDPACSAGPSRALPRRRAPTMALGAIYAVAAITISPGTWRRSEEYNCALARSQLILFASSSPRRKRKRG